MAEKESASSKQDDDDDDDEFSDEEAEELFFNFDASTGAPKARPPSESDTAERLRKLQELFDQEIISAELMEERKGGADHRGGGLMNVRR